MSLRDEMAKKAEDAYYRGAAPGEIADALMPIVERVAREAVKLADKGGSVPKFTTDEIVQRVVGK